MASQASKTQAASEKQSAKQRPAAPVVIQKSAAPTELAGQLQCAIANPEAARPADILKLQRRYGNQSVQRLLAQRVLQTRLTVGAAGDAYEQEADRVASQVMLMAAPQTASRRPAVQRAEEEEQAVQTKPLVASITPLVQRSAEDEEEVQTKALVQRSAEDEEEIQTKALVQRSAEDEEEIQTKRQDPRAGFEAGSTVEDQLRANKGSGSPLPAEVRSYMEPRFGTDFGGVRVHTGSDASQLNRQLSAQAFTHGRDIYMGDGRYSPSTSDGQRLLAHELTHVVQQTGSVQRQEASPVAPQLKQDADTVQRLTLEKLPNPPELLPPEVEETQEMQGDLKEIINRLDGKTYWINKDDLEEFMTGHLEGREVIKPDLYVDTEMWPIPEQPIGMPTPQAPGPQAGKLKRAGKAVAGFLFGGKKLEPKSVVFYPSKLMTSKEFIESTGVTRRRLIPRLLVGSSYDAVIGFLEEYETLQKKDPQGKQKTKRMEILKDILDNIQKWFASLNREKIAANDEAKLATMSALHAQIVVERRKLLALDSKALEKTQQITSVPGPFKSLPTTKDLEDKNAPKQDLTFKEKAKAFFARTGQRLKNFFKYVFKVDFRPQDVVALTGQTLTLDEMRMLVTLIDEAMMAEKRLLGEKPDNQLAVIAEAYEFLPDQLRPKTADPEERIALQVKKHLFQEAIAREEAKAMPLKKETTKEKAGRYAKTATEYTTLGVGYGGTATQAGGSATAGVGAAVKGMAGMVDGGKGVADVAFQVKAISTYVAAFGRVVGFMKFFFNGDFKKIGSNSPAERAVAVMAIKAQVPDLIQTVGDILKGVFQIGQAFAGLSASAVPIVGAVFAFIDMLTQIWEGLKRIYRLWKERKVIGMAETGAKHLVGALTSFTQRNLTLAVRAGVKIIIDALQMAGNIVMAVDPTGSVGTVISVVGTVLGILEGIGEALHESYRAGLRQESERHAEVGEEGSSKKVMKNSPTYAATAIILEAKAGNAVALKALKVYGITPDMLKKSTVDQIRTLLFRKLQEEEDPKNIGQKVVGIFATLGLRERI